jgi:hypothetical protein
MLRHFVVSSDLKSAGYDPATRTLEIEFHSGGVYQYSGVSEWVYQALMAAPSHGRYFHANIKGRYRYRKL